MLCRNRCSSDCVHFHLVDVCPPGVSPMEYNILQQLANHYTRCITEYLKSHNNCVTITSDEQSTTESSKEVPVSLESETLRNERNNMKRSFNDYSMDLDEEENSLKSRDNQAIKRQPIVISKDKDSTFKCPKNITAPKAKVLRSNQNVQESPNIDNLKLKNIRNLNHEGAFDSFDTSCEDPPSDFFSSGMLLATNEQQKKEKPSKIIEKNNNLIKDIIESNNLDISKNTYDDSSMAAQFDSTSDDEDSIYELKNWSIMMTDSGLVVDGFSDKNPDLLIQSGPIIRRIKKHLLQSKSGAIYKLNGSMHSEDAIKAGFSKTIVSSFLDGFPKSWRSLLKDNKKNSEFFSSRRGENGDIISADKLPRTGSGRSVKPPLKFWNNERLRYNYDRDDVTVCSESGNEQTEENRSTKKRTRKSSDLSKRS